MNNECFAAFFSNRADEVEQELITVVLINANAGFHGHGDVCGLFHGINTIGHQFWLRHQAGAKLAALYTVTGAAAIQVHFVITVIFRHFGANAEVFGVGAAKLRDFAQPFLALIAEFKEA